MNSDVPLYLFAKKPVAGRVKTRLQSHCSPAEAATIAEELIRATVELVVANWDGQVRLCVWPDAKHSVFEEMRSTHSISIDVQAAGELGKKLLHALDVGVSAYGAAAVMGCDVPHCPAAIIRRTYKALAQRRNVIGPSLDGGFYLLGMCQTHSDVFRDISWSTPSVAANIERNFRHLGINIDLRLPMLRDIDSWADLATVAQRFQRLSAYVA